MSLPAVEDDNKDVKNVTTAAVTVPIPSSVDELNVSSLPLYDNNNNNNNNNVFSIEPTDMIYMTYEGNFITECSGTILDFNTDDTAVQEQLLNTEVCVVLDRTVMHAQGGGQPTDIGQMLVAANINGDDLDHHKEKDETQTSTTTTININRVVLDRTTGIVRHYGTIVDGESPDDEQIEESERIRRQNQYYPCYPIGASVRVLVNNEHRRILSECHTAGHVVDAVMVNCGYRLKPSKGYHYLDSPYVEYYMTNDTATTATKTTTIASFNDTQLLPRLQETFQQLLQENIPTQIELLSKQEAHVRCNYHHHATGSNDTGSDDESSFVFFDMDQYASSSNTSTPDTVRIVTVAGYACPCGGTHVYSTGELLLHQWNVTGIKMKKGFVRIKYGMKQQ